MSSKFLLETFFKGKPTFSPDFAVLSAPVRHMFITGTLWHLSKKAVKVPQILEVGSWFGASTITFAKALEQFFDAKGSITSIDAWQPFFNTDENKGSVYDFMEAALSTDVAYDVYRHNVSTIPASILCQHFRAKSDIALPMMCKDHFDVVYIDGDHSYNGVKSDILNALDLVKEGGLICGDDLNLQMSECDQDFAKNNKQIDFTKDPKTNRNFHPGVTVAVDEIFGPVSSYGGFWVMEKVENEWQPIDLSSMPVIFPSHLGESNVEKARSHFEDIQKEWQNVA